MFGSPASDCDRYFCFLAVFSSPHSCEMFLHGVSAPRVRCRRGTRAEKGQSLGQKYKKRAVGLEVMIKMRGRQERRTLHAYCPVQGTKLERNLGSKYL